MDYDHSIDVDVVVIVVVATVDWAAPTDTPPVEPILLVMFFLAQVHPTHLSILLIIPTLEPP